MDRDWTRHRRFDERNRRFAEWLRAAMIGKGWNLAQTAEQCGVSDGAVSKWRNGQTQIDMETIPRVAAAFGVDPLYLQQIAGYTVGQSSAPQEPETARELIEAMRVYLDRLARQLAG